MPKHNPKRIKKTKAAAAKLKRKSKLKKKKSVNNGKIKQGS